MTRAQAQSRIAEIEKEAGWHALTAQYLRWLVENGEVRLPISLPLSVNLDDESPKYERMPIHVFRLRPGQDAEFLARKIATWAQIDRGCY